MIEDTYNTFAAAVALNTGGAGTYQVGDSIDLGAASPPVFDPDDIYCVIKMDVTATSGGSATGQFQLVTAATSTLTSSPNVMYQSPAIPVATLVGGYIIAAFELPKGLTLPYLRYMGILQVTAVAAFTAGKVSAFLTPDVAVWQAMKAGI